MALQLTENLLREIVHRGGQPRTSGVYTLTGHVIAAAALRFDDFENRVRYHALRNQVKNV